MNPQTILKWTVLAITGIVGLLVLIAVIVVIFGVTIRLDFLRPSIEKGVSEALDRPVTIEGAIELVPSMRPTVTVSDLTIDNPPDLQEHPFFKVALARTQIDLPDLLAREISIGEITAEGFELHLVSDAQGRNNWIINADREKQYSEKKPIEKKKTSATTNGSPADRRIRFTALDQLSLKDIRMTYYDAVMNQTIELKVVEFSGSAKAGEPVQFDLSGRLQGQDYRFHIDGGSLVDLRDRQASWPLKISGQVAGTPIDASGELNREEAEPRLHLGFSVDSVNIGALLAELNIAEDLDASTERFAIDAMLVGDSLYELIARSKLSITLEGGQWTLQDPNTQAKLPIQIVNGNITVAPEQPITLKVNGRIDQAPIAFSMTGMSLIDLINQPDAMTVHIAVQAVGALLKFDGRLAMPIQSRDSSLTMTFEGETLNTLEELIPVDLPPFGPYRLEARFAVVETGYELSNLHLKVGDSQLDGSLKLVTLRDKPRTDIRLTSQQLQLDDFSTAGWSTETRGTHMEKLTPSPDAQKVREPDQHANGLLSPDVLNAFDAKMDVEVAQVLSGNDNLGGGMLGIAIQDGRLSIEPLHLDVPGGSIQMGFGYHPTANSASVHLNAHIDRFDVGILVRRIDPDKKLGGRLSLDVELEGTAPERKQFLANTSGHIDFAFWPENLASGIIDLWAVNLITVLSEKVDDEPSSTLNCMVARFDLENGLMQEKAIFMDTTRMSVSADATVDFREQKIDVLAVPTAKRPEYFSLATPVKVRGTFSDFGIGVNKLSLAKTVVSFITSPITVTFKRLFAGKVPEDGVAACAEAWNMDETK